MTHLIPLEGPVNVRDLGDRVTADGRKVVAGRIWRGDNPDGLSTSDADVLFGQLGIRTVVDLRGPNEAARSPLETYSERDATYVNTPVITAHGLSNPMLDPEATDLGDYYRSYLADGPTLVLAAVRAVIDASAEPVLVHCAAGKDRTGVVCSIVLSLLGVSTEDIIEDYSFTSTRIDLIIARLISAHPEYAERISDAKATIMTAAPETMAKFLDGLDVEAWCIDAGLQPVEIDRLRGRMLA